MLRIKKALKNEYIFSVLAKIYLILVGVVISSLKVRSLGKDLSGRLLYMTNQSQMLSVFFLFGFNQAYAYLKRKKKEEIRDRFLGATILLAAVYMTLCGLSCLFIPFDRETKAVILFVTPVFIQTALGGVTMVDRPRVRNVLHVLSDSLLMLLLIFLYFFVEPSFTSVCVIFVFIDIVRLLLYIIILRPAVKIDKETFGLLKWLLAYGLVPMLGSFLLNVNYKIDVYMLKKVFAYEVVSVYTVGVVVADQCWALSTALADILLSKLTGGKGEKEVCRVLRYANTLTLLIQLGFLLVGRFAVILLYGEGYVESYTVLCLVMLGSYGMNFTKMIGSYCIVEGRTKARTQILMVAAVVNIVLNLYLIPFIGIRGAAIASIVSYSLCGTCFIVLFKKWTGSRIGDMLIARGNDIKDILKLLKLTKA